ncbi:MAG: DUF6328 family protein, partial [Acidobacteriaceae bacterium]
LYFLTIFDRLPRLVRVELTVALGLMLVGLGLLMFPAAYHQIVARGEDSADLHVQATMVTDWTLITFAIGLGSYSAMAAYEVMGSWWAAAVGIIGFLLSVAFWYLFPWSARRNHQGARATYRKLQAVESEQRREKGEMTSIDEKIKTALIECRMVLPGAQALLGFQLVTFVEPGFEPLPYPDKLMHVGSLMAIGISTILLMAPAAFHRIAEGGENTERMYRYTSRLLLWAMFFLALGISSDFAMVLHKVSHSYPVAGGVSGTLLGLYFALWFGYSWWKGGSQQLAISN